MEAMMLEPNSRCIYLEELRPPVGYRLDRAVATTFSLDLLTLLMAPLSMALNECRNRQDALKDPIAVLEALRQTTSRLTVFCQEGRIAVPQKDALLYRYLESVVVQVRPRSGAGVFHPKSWLLRFVAEDQDEPVFYRFLCLSRNLTFDRSWDTVMSLEGPLQDRKLAHARNRPLSDFFESLSTLAVREMSERQRGDLALMVDEVLRVKFDPPEGFDDEIMFLPMGIPGHDRIPNNDDARRVLVVSPFLSDPTVLSLLDAGDNNVLISRPDSLDGLKAKTVTSLEENTKLFALDDAAERPEEDVEAGAGDSDPTAQVPADNFSGLHAKLYIIENGWYATVFSGSANATGPAMAGGNIELLVGLLGSKSRVGIDAFLGSEDGPLSFRGMLKAYTREGVSAPDKTDQLLEKAMEAARRGIAKAGPFAHVVSSGTGTYEMAILSASPLTFPSGVEAKCFPISLALADAQGVGGAEPPRFLGLPLESLTGFVAFVVSAERDERRASMGFVLSLPVQGMPTHRDQCVLQKVISDPARFIRYLLLILAEEQQITGPEFDPQDSKSNGGIWGSASGLPLLEEMLRAFSRHPEKIARIKELVDELKASPEGATVLPPGFDDLWATFLAASPGAQA